MLRTMMPRAMPRFPMPRMRRGGAKSSKVLNWAKSAARDVNAFLKRSKLGSKIASQLVEFIPNAQLRGMADIGLATAKQEGYGRRRGSRKTRLGSGLRLAGAARRRR